MAEIRRSPVEVGRLSHYIFTVFFSTFEVVGLGIFEPSTVGLIGCGMWSQWNMMRFAVFQERKTTFIDWCAPMFFRLKKCSQDDYPP